MKTSESISELAGALSKAQASFKPIIKDKTVRVKTRTGGEYTFSYAPLESIMAAVREALSANGLFLSQALTSIDGHDFIETAVLHATGQWLSNLTPVLVQEQGPQAYGSAITYARRYGVTTLLCLVADDDDDGNGAEGNAMTPASKAAPASRKPDNTLISPEQLAELRAIITDIKADEAGFAKFCGVPSLPQLPAKQFDKAKAALENKRARTATTAEG